MSYQRRFSISLNGNKYARFDLAMSSLRHMNFRANATVYYTIIEYQGKSVISVFTWNIDIWHNGNLNSISAIWFAR